MAGAETQPIAPVPLLALLSLALFATYRLLVYPLFFHPLRNIPSAHWSIPIFGDLWILLRRYRSLNNATTLAAHDRFGPVVRLGRNEVSISLVDNGIKTVYGGGFEKHPWYPQQFASYGVVNMFSTLHHAPHSQKKRTMANVYSKSYLQTSEQVKANSKALVLGRFLPTIQALADNNESVDMHDLDNAMTMDFMSAYQYGIAASTNFTQDKAVRNHIMHHYHSRRPYEFFSSEIPWLKPLGEKLGIFLVPKLLDSANDILEDWGKAMCLKAERWLANPTERPGEEPIVYKQFKQGLTNLRLKDPEAAKSKDDLILPTHTVSHNDDTRLEVYSEMLDHLGAGHETSAVALTYLWYELAKNPTLQSAVRKEIRTLNPRIIWPLPASSDLNTPASISDIDLPTPKQIDALPLLHAILYEVLRLHTPIPGMQPRVTPHNTTTTLGPYTNIPGGIRVSAMPYTLHRNPAVFPSPTSFQPRRWLDSSPEHLKEMHRWFWAFGSGGRMCIGSHLAMQEMKLVVCALLGNYEVDVVEGGDEGIEEIDAYTVRPKSNRLVVKWKAVKW